MPPFRQTMRVAGMLAFVAGGVDAVGYLTLNRLFTAHMSGNAVAMAVALGDADLLTFSARALPILLFVMGIALGVLTVERAVEHGLKHPFIPVYCGEALLLVGLWLFGPRLAPAGALQASNGWPFFVLAGLATLAMGLQNATLRRVGSLNVPTTYMSGVLTSLAIALAHWCFGAPSTAPPAGLRMRLYGGLLVAYVVGATASTVAHVQWGFGGLAVPVAVLAVVVAIDARHPHELGLV